MRSQPTVLSVDSGPAGKLAPIGTTLVGSGELPMLLLRLLFLLLLSSPTLAQGSVNEWPCPTCDGKGSAQVACRLCFGEGQIDCSGCSGRAVGTPPLMPWRPYAFLQQVCERLSKEFHPLSAPTHLPPAFKRGNRGCHASCDKGRMQRLGREDKCLVCRGKGYLGCAVCDKRGRLRCSLCKGRGHAQSACADCGGAGTHPDPSKISLIDLGTCSWCAGKAELPCKVCDEERKRERPCWTCDASGKVNCIHCAGQVRAPCLGCKATGKVLAGAGASAATTRCKLCKGRGHQLCSDCNQGKVRCADCAGKGRGRLPCDLCNAQRMRPCAGCHGGWPRSWIVAGTGLAKAAEPRRARFFLEFAIAEIEGRIELLERLEAWKVHWAAQRLKANQRERARLAAIVDGLQKD